MPQVYVENLKNPKMRFKVLKYDKATGVGVLKGELGVEWTRDISKKTLEKLGYKLIVVPDA